MADSDRTAWARARECVAGYVPADEDQLREQARILAFLDQHPDALLRSCLPGHLTSSALLLDASRERALLTHHRKLNRWLQLGGHVDGDGDLARSALREGVEESGIADLLLDPQPMDLDIHTIPARKTEPEHLHLDVRFVLQAPEGARYQVSEESHDLAWVAPGDLERYETDESVVRLFRRVFGASALPASLR